MRLRHMGALLKELHTPGVGLASYIEGLLSLESEGASNEAIAWLCGLAHRRVVLEASIQRVLWRAILQDTALSEANKERLLGLVHSRIFEVKLIQALPAPAAESDDDDGVDTSFHKPPPLQSQDFLLRVSRYIFPTDSALDGQSPSQIVVKNWTRYLSQTMFDPKFSTSTRWMNLIHLAYANTPTAEVSQAVSHIRLPGQDGGSLHPVDLRAIVLLTVFERLASRDQLQAQMGPIVEHLWRLWAMSVREHITVHSTLVRPLLASFFMLAGHLRDPALLNRMLDLSIDKSWIWAFDFGDDPAREQVRALVSAYIAASALSGQVVWEEIIAGVPSYAAFPQWVPSLLGAALARVACVEPERAAELHVRWGSHVALPRQTHAPVALALANAGRSDLALRLLPECDFRPVDALRAFGAVLYSLCKGRKTLDVNAIDALSVTLKAAVETTTIPSYMRGRFAWLLFQLIRAGQPYVDIAMQTIIAMQKKDLRFFERNQVGGLIRALLRRRYFKHAMTLLERVNGHYSRRAVSSWARTAVTAFVRTTHRDFVPVAKSLIPSTKLVARAKALITHPEIKHDPYASVVVGSLDLRRSWRQALALSSRRHEHRTDRSPAFARAIRVILTMRGEKKLMNLLRRLGSRLFVWERTAVGNILLRYWVNRRDRRMHNDGNIFATLEMLKIALGFKPDRITVNILVGRALRRSTCPTRALFNELVRHGYPAPNGPPFDIPWRGPPVLVLTMSDGMKNKISFTKHGRPLYKTFIRALARKGDLEGMRVVIGALKCAQEQHGVRLREQRIRRAQRRVGLKLDEVSG
ncbi:hypothetical protein PENSPDRAFT_687472 [Peniophora sp. CONT]|nr:hypothetical protein PENSPDRAFT_687472 [Peniophora sp. CONT]